MNYNLYIFDLDGTIINSEYYHYLAYKNQAKELSYLDYQKIFHNNILKETFCKNNNISKDQKERDFKILYEKNASYINGFLIFFKKLMQLNKKICIYTASSHVRCELSKELHPELILIDYWLTKDDVMVPIGVGFFWPDVGI